MAKLNTDTCSVCLEEFCSDCDAHKDCDECCGTVCSECIGQGFLACGLCENKVCKNCLDTHSTQCIAEQDEDEEKEDGLAKDKD